MALNVYWSPQVTNNELYGELPRLSEKRAIWYVRFTYQIATEPRTSQCLDWCTSYEHVVTKRGKPTLTCTDTLKLDTGLEKEDILERNAR